MNDDAEFLVNRTFSIAEVGVLLALSMTDWNVTEARRCFEELGGHPGAFERILERLKKDCVLKAHPRRTGYVQLDQLCEGLRLRYERIVAQAEEAANGDTNR